MSKSLFESEKVQELINLEVLDITQSIDQRYVNLIHVAIDKGTYDAISLCPDEAQSKLEKYRDNIYHMVKDRGYLLIFSCNWTEQELKSQFIDDTENRWVFHKLFPSISFSFGGKAGTNVTSIVFQKN